MSLNCNKCKKDSKNGILIDCVFKCSECIKKRGLMCPNCEKKLYMTYDRSISGNNIWRGNEPCYSTTFKCINCDFIVQDGDASEYDGKYDSESDDSKNDTENDSNSDNIISECDVYVKAVCPTCERIVPVDCLYVDCLYEFRSQESSIIVGHHVFKCTTECRVCNNCIRTHYELENGKKLSEIEANEYLAQNERLKSLFQKIRKFN